MKPEISAVLFVPHSLQDALKTIVHLQNQAGAAIELILAAPKGVLPERLDFPPLSVKQVEVANMATTVDALSVVIRDASSPIIVLTEDHSFPQPGWAAALVRAHEEHWYAVGPMSENANQNTTLSRADFLMNFLDYTSKVAGPTDRLMGHNTSYKKERLLELETEELTRFLRCELLLHTEWGFEHCLHLPEARVRHVNISRLRPFLLHKFYGGLVFGSERCRYWNSRRRALYLLGAWAIPLVRAARIVNALLDSPTDSRTAYLTAAPWAILGLLWHAVGEVVGYWKGPEVATTAYQTYANFEQNRWRDVCREDLKLKDPNLPTQQFADTIPR